MTSSAAERQGPGRVVVGVDGSPPSVLALRWARYLAQQTGDTLELVGAWQNPGAYGTVGVGWYQSAPDWTPDEDTRAALRAALADAFGDSDSGDDPVITVREGSPAQVLIEASEGARFVVVGSRGRGGFTGLLLGSVSTTVTEHAHCPVLVVRGTTPPP